MPVAILSQRDAKEVQEKCGKKPKYCSNYLFAFLVSSISYDVTSFSIIIFGQITYICRKLASVKLGLVINVNESVHEKCFRYGKNY